MSDKEQDIISSYEDARQQALRRLRRDSRQNAGELVGYLATTGATLALTGDEEAPYVKVINPSSEPVNVTVIGELSAEIEGNIANDLADGATKPVKVGGRAVASIAGIAAVAADDRVDGAYSLRGHALMALAGGNLWTKYNTAYTVLDEFPVAGATPMLLGRLSITLDEAEADDLYAFVFDGASAAGTLVDRFFIPAAESAVRDYTTEGSLLLSVGCFVALSTTSDQVTAPTLGGYCHAIYQAL